MFIGLLPVAFLTTYMQEANVEMWTGLNDISWPDRYLWTDGKAFRFSNWAKGHPKRDPGRIGDVSMHFHPLSVCVCVWYCMFVGVCVWCVFLKKKTKQFFVFFKHF